MTISIQAEDVIVGKSGDRRFTLIVYDNTVSVRSLIEMRIHRLLQEKGDRLNDSVTPSTDRDAREVELNPSRREKPDSDKRKRLVEEACEAFEKNGFFVLVDGVQKTDLDEMVPLTPDSEIRFLQLVPLVGG